MDSSITRGIYTILNITIFLGFLSAVLLASYRFESGLDAVNKSSTKNDAVVTVGEELVTRDKSYISGTTVLCEIISLSDDVTIQIDGQVINNLKTSSGDSYMEHARKYGTRLLEKKLNITSSGKYRRQVTVDSDGNMTGVSYRLA